jgi:hypothetical protein
LDRLRGESTIGSYKPGPQTRFLVTHMDKTEQSLMDCISKLNSQLAPVEKKVDKFVGYLGGVHAKVDLVMTSINLVQQEQVHVSKLLKTSDAGAAPFNSVVMGAPPGSSSSGTISTSMQPQLPHPSALLLRNTKVNNIPFPCYIWFRHTRHRPRSSRT